MRFHEWRLSDLGSDLWMVFSHSLWNSLSGTKIPGRILVNSTSLYEWMFIGCLHLNDTLMGVWVTALRSMTSVKASYRDNAFFIVKKKEKINNTKCETVQIQLRSLYSWNPGVGLLGTVKQLRLKESKIASLQWWITDWSVWPVLHRGGLNTAVSAESRELWKYAGSDPVFLIPWKLHPTFPIGPGPFIFIKCS